MEEKKYTKAEVINIISFVAQTCSGLKPSEECINAIPDELHRDLMASILAAGIVKKLKALSEETSPMESALDKIIKEAERKFGKA